MTTKITDGEMKLMEIVWERGEIRSGELAGLAFERLGWKKSTVYTLLKKLSNKGVISSIQSVITPNVSREEALSERSGEVLSSGYRGSLPMFLTAFLQKSRLSAEEARELKRLIDEYTEGGDEK